MSSVSPVVHSRLAIDGGEPVAPRGYLMMSRWPRLTRDDIDAMLRQIETGLFTEMSAPAQVREFEAEMAIICGVRYALAVNSGTAALHCALAGAGVQSGDEVVVPALTYIACAAAVLHHQGIPVFADVDPNTYNMTSDTVSKVLSPQTRAILAVHLHGLPAPMEELQQLCRKHNLVLVEDFSQAVGASYHGRPTGSLGDVGAASLMAGKNLPSAGEAGILVTNNRELRNRAACLKAFSEQIDEFGNHALTHSTMGWNYRINLLSAVMVSRQLYGLEEFNAQRQANAKRIDATLATIRGFTGPSVPKDCHHVYHMYRFRFDPREAGLSITIDQAHDAIKKVFQAEGLPVVEFQNQPLPGHDLLQGRIGYGRGCPWRCHGRDGLTYRIEDYPGALQAIRDSLVIGYPSQATLANGEIVDRYIQVFEKIRDNLRIFERFAAEQVDRPPWVTPARMF